jgi:hypothetical protein
MRHGLAILIVFGFAFPSGGIDLGSLARHDQGSDAVSCHRSQPFDCPCIGTTQTVRLRVAPKLLCGGDLPEEIRSSFDGESTESRIHSRDVPARWTLQSQSVRLQV